MMKILKKGFVIAMIALTLFVGYSFVSQGDSEALANVVWGADP